MSVLVFLEHHGNDLDRGSLGVLAKAAAVAGGDVAAVLVGAGPLGPLASQAGKFGATTVYVAEDDAFDPPLPQPRVDALEAAVRSGGHDTVLFSNSVLAADAAAGLAARLEAGLNWDLVDIAIRGDELSAHRPALQDSLLIEVGWRSAVRLGLFRAGSFEPAAGSDGEPRIESLSVQPQEH
jgi:electron transfer flavoprotein alpha subunit